ncbi:ATP-binding protein [Kitasatospora cineracea]
MGVEEVEGVEEQLDLTPSPRLLEVLGDLPYRPWQCLAELIDNSFDDFIGNPDPDADVQPTVRVTLPRPSAGDDQAEVAVADNGRGMSAERLQNALKAGYSSNTRYGHLGLFGMGFNIATARLGQITEVRTSRAGDADWLIAEINFQEMRARDSFRVPLRREPKDDILTHGTQVVVRRLKPEIRDALKRANTVSSIRDMLGNVYSYLLRSEQPIAELPDANLLGRGFQLYVNSRRVKARLPCIWNASRKVDYKGTEIKAVQIVDRELPAAFACLSCGHWNKVETEDCVECGSQSIELRERRIWGWLGIQRYLDATDFGVDFIRNGRKILTSDKSLFTWENADTGESFVEYPIELPANQGRIVGEIHLDHAPVFYQKTDFDRASREWNDAVTVIRGEAPMQPEKARKRLYAENTTALARLFKGFRRNDPGLKCLIPGDGSKATHEQARTWAADFRKGLAEFMTDQAWFEGAQKHDAIKSGIRNSGKNDGSAVIAGGDSELGMRTGLGGPAATVPKDVLKEAEKKPGDKNRVETEEERFDRYRKSARTVASLRGEVNIQGVGKRLVRVFETREELLSPDGKNVPCLIHAGQGAELHVFVNGEHEIFREYGREPRDYAVFELAEFLRTLGNLREKVTSLAPEITRQLPDQRITDAALRERAEGILRTVRELVLPIASKHPDDLWACLPQQGKLLAERQAARTEPKLNWRKATANGEFAAYLDAFALASLVRSRPEALLDGNVFAATWSDWNDPDAKNRQVGRIARLLETAAEFLADSGRKGRLELSITRLTLDMLEDELAQAE